MDNKVNISKADDVATSETPSGIPQEKGYDVVTTEDGAQAIEGKSGARDGFSVVDLKKYQVQREALRLIPEEMARKYDVMPLRIERGYLVVAMSRPENLYTVDEIQNHARMPIQPWRAASMDIQAAINLHYRAKTEIEKEIEQLSSADPARVPAGRIMDLLIAGAVKDRASDIHIEPQQDSLRIRYRIDGRLHNKLSLPLNVHAPLLSRLKVLANMDTTERRRSQDGQLTVSVDGQDVNIRATTVNAARGEVAVLRVVEQTWSAMDIADVGFLPDSLERYRDLIQSRSGLVLITGPAGSGKGTTLYASINCLNVEERNIVTIENPIEHYFEGVKQIQVNPQIDLTFASGLQTIMRLDPDVILVGTIADAESAMAAIEAALSGPLVLSSVHANTATGALFRLFDLGVEPFLVSSSVLGVVNQRLVRRVCPHCASLREAPEEERLAYEREMGEARTQFYYGAGCKSCADTGYLGRTGIFEVLKMSGEIKRMLMGGVRGKDIKDQAVKEGMTTLQRAAMLKVKEGLTTPQEVLRNIFFGQ